MYDMEERDATPHRQSRRLSHMSELKTYSVEQRSMVPTAHECEMLGLTAAHRVWIYVTASSRAQAIRLLAATGHKAPPSHHVVEDVGPTSSRLRALLEGGAFGHGRERVLVTTNSVGAPVLRASGDRRTIIGHLQWTREAGSVFLPVKSGATPIERGSGADMLAALLAGQGDVIRAAIAVLVANGFTPGVRADVSVGIRLDGPAHPFADGPRS
jgi:hypothetical protein